MAVAPRYQSILPIASGGMGRVELSLRSDGSFEHLYAIKRLHENLRDDAGVRTMFLDEARLAGLIRHANVVSVLDVGEDEAGPFLVMDFIEGRPVTSILAHHATLEQTMPLQLALRIGVQIAAGLHAAHELRDAHGEPLHLVHRDVSPHNVLVGFDGVVRLTDFGVAKALGRATQTDAGVLKGKLSYMSPEQLRFVELDRRSDLFSMGILLFQLVEGRHPFGSNATQRAAAVVAELGPDLTETQLDTPPELLELLCELLAGRRELRPDSADDVRARLEAILADELATDDPLSLADYMQHAHGEFLHHWQERVRAARQELELARDEPEKGPEQERTALDAASVRRPWFIIGLLGALTAALGAIAGVALLQDDATSGLHARPTPPEPQPLSSSDAGFASDTIDAAVADVDPEPADADVVRSPRRRRAARRSGSRPGLMDW